jgi:hypothetical protein
LAPAVLPYVPRARPRVILLFISLLSILVPYTMYIIQRCICFSKRHRPVLDLISFKILSSQTQRDLVHPNGRVSSTQPNAL